MATTDRQLKSPEVVITIVVINNSFCLAVCFPNKNEFNNRSGGYIQRSHSPIISLFLVPFLGIVIVYLILLTVCMKLFTLLLWDD